MKTPPTTMQPLGDAARRGIAEISADAMRRRPAMAAKNLACTGFGAIASLAGGRLGRRQEGRPLASGA